MNTEPKNIILDVKPMALFKLALAVALFFFVTKIFNVILLVFLGFLLAVSLAPIMRRLEGWGLPKQLAVAIIALTMVGIAALFFLVLIPSIFEQINSIIKDLPRLKGEILKHIPGDHPLKSILSQADNNPKLTSPDVWMGHAVEAMNAVLEGLSEVILILIFSVYLLLDGNQAFKWFADFFKAPTRAKLQATADETAPVVYGYVVGQVVTSVLSTLYTFGVLSILKVPVALTLAILAGLFDVVPILGFFMAVIPAILLALTVSPGTALGVFGLYTLYHGIENYFIVPLVYGNSLKVSTLVVLIALLVAGLIGGILGAIAVLPVVASYPIFERIWLVKYLGKTVVQKHLDVTGDKGGNSPSTTLV